MAKKKRLPWIKLYGDYTTTPSHAELDDRALWTGVALMQLVRAGCDARDDREPWALQPSGEPCSVYAIARHARQPQPIAQRGLNLLIAAGTVARRSDGAYGVPNFWSFQETPDAERKRGKKTGKSAQIPLVSPVQDEERKDDVDLRSTTPTPADEVVDAIVAHRKRLRLSALTKRERTPKHIEALLAEGVPLADLLEVVEIRAREAEVDEKAAGYFDCVSPFTGPNPNGQPGGWSYSRSKLDRERRRSSSSRLTDWTPPGGVTADELDRRLGEGRHRGDA